MNVDADLHRWPIRLPLLCENGVLVDALVPVWSKKVSSSRPNSE